MKRPASTSVSKTLTTGKFGVNLYQRVNSVKRYGWGLSTFSDRVSHWTPYVN
jgi:hypothetical protein